MTRTMPVNKYIDGAFIAEKMSVDIETPIEAETAK